MQPIQNYIPKDYREPCCGNCPFWNHQPEMTMKESDGSLLRGLCQQENAKNFLVPVQTLKGDALGFEARFPLMTEKQWCGKHPQREAEARADSLLSSLEILAQENNGFAEIFAKVGLAPKPPKPGE